MKNLLLLVMVVLVALVLIGCGSSTAAEPTAAPTSTPEPVTATTNCGFDNCNVFEKDNTVSNATTVPQNSPITLVCRPREGWFGATFGELRFFVDDSDLTFDRDDAATLPNCAEVGFTGDINPND